jgi:hypothetical protein
MSEHIHWEDNEARWDDNGSLLGYAGTFGGWLFQIFKASEDADDSTLALMSQLPGTLGDYRHSEDVATLKAEAECWLAEFVSSLGASFPEEASQ